MIFIVVLGDKMIFEWDEDKYFSERKAISQERKPCNDIKEERKF